MKQIILCESESNRRNYGILPETYSINLNFQLGDICFVNVSFLDKENKDVFSSLIYFDEDYKPLVKSLGIDICNPILSTLIVKISKDFEDEIQRAGDSDVIIIDFEVFFDEWVLYLDSLLEQFQKEQNK